MKPIFKNAESSNDFVGIKFKDGIPTISFPYGYDLLNYEKTSNERKNITKLLKLLSYSRSYIKNNNIIHEGGDFIKGYPLFDHLWLIQDYLVNGIYTTLEKEHSTYSNGKVNWKRTIDGPFIISKRGPIYIQLIYDKYVANDSLITRLHEYCLQEAYKITSWYFGNIELPRNTKQIKNSNKEIAYLKNVLKKTFNDRNKLLIKTMINIIKNSDTVADAKKTYEFGTYNFEITWEFLVNRLFGNTDASRFYPGASYNILNQVVSAKSKLRPDTILILDEAYVIDAKYYRFGITGSNDELPPTSDIYKQIVYGEYVSGIASKLYEIDDTYNVFVLPYNMNEDLFKLGVKDKSIFKIGYAETMWSRLLANSIHSKILVVLLDSKAAISWLNKKIKVDVLNKFILEVKK